MHSAATMGRPFNGRIVTRYAAFLRGINVGKHNRIRMDDLRDSCAEGGLGNVRTYLQTGNLVFDADVSERDAASLIEDLLTRRGLRNVTPAVRQQRELEALLETEAFHGLPGDDEAQLVTLFGDLLLEDVRAFALSTPGVVLVREREVCQLVSREALARGRTAQTVIERRFKIQGTTRYWHVVEAVTALLSD